MFFLFDILIQRCVWSSNLNLAVELATKYNQPTQISSLLAKYAQHLLDDNKILQVSTQIESFCMSQNDSFSKIWLKIKLKVINRLVLGVIWQQRRSWFIIAQTRPNSSGLVCPKYHLWGIFPTQFLSKNTNFMSEF